MDLNALEGKGQRALWAHTKMCCHNGDAVAPCDSVCDAQGFTTSSARHGTSLTVSGALSAELTPSVHVQTCSRSTAF